MALFNSLCQFFPTYSISYVDWAWYTLTTAVWGFIAQTIRNSKIVWHLVRMYFTGWYIAPNIVWLYVYTHTYIWLYQVYSVFVNVADESASQCKCQRKMIYNKTTAFTCVVGNCNNCTYAHVWIHKLNKMTTLFSLLPCTWCTVMYIHTHTYIRMCIHTYYIHTCVHVHIQAHSQGVRMDQPHEENIHYLVMKGPLFK